MRKQRRENHLLMNPIEIFQLSYYTCLIRIYEPAISLPPSSTLSNELSSTGPFHRTDCIWKFFQACIDWINTQLAIPASEVNFLSSDFMSSTAFTNVSMSRLMLMDSCPDWDSAFARSKYDYADGLRRLADLYEAADQVARDNGRRRRVFDDGGSAFLKFSSKMRWISQWYLSKMHPNDQHAPTGKDASLPSYAASGDQWSNMNMGFDENIWQDLMTFNDPSIFGSFCP